MKYTAYIDETGTHALDTSCTGESNLFICTAVMVKVEEHDCVESRMKHISAKYFGGSEVKSKNIGRNHERRMQVLKELEGTSFSYFSLIVNKDRIDRDTGLRYKKAFYKFVNKMLYERLLKEFGSLHIIADTIGGREYMDSFKRYLSNKRLSLLSTFTHCFKDSKTTPLLQLADLITGTLGYCFVDTKIGPHSQALREILRSRELYVQVWPLRSSLQTAKVSCTNDDAILMSSQERAQDFINGRDLVDDEFSQMRICIVNKLLFQHVFEFENKKSLSASELMDYLEGRGFERPSGLTFRSKIIGKIRDAGIIISGTSKGYRLAGSRQDIEDYLEHNRNIIEPMLSRLRRAQTVIKTDVSVELDILAGQNFQLLKMIVECYADAEGMLFTSREDASDAP